MENKKGIVVTFGNFKGGTGKTTTSAMLAYALSEKGYKVLVSDQDPQANASDMFLKTKSLIEGEDTVYSETIFTAIQKGNLKDAIIPIKENLYLLPSDKPFSKFPRIMNSMFADYNDQVYYFSSILEEIKSDYDFIFLDVPPTISLITDSALYASDFVVIVMQTQEWGLAGAEGFVEYLNELIEDYDAILDVIGILPVILKSGARIDTATYDDAVETFGSNNIFKEPIMFMERLKQYPRTGIEIKDIHDKRVLEKFDSIADIFLKRLENELEGVE